LAKPLKTLQSADCTESGRLPEADAVRPVFSCDAKALADLAQSIDRRLHRISLLDDAIFSFGLEEKRAPVWRIRAT
jgi:hypothetical protein